MRLFLASKLSSDETDNLRRILQDLDPAGAMGLPRDPTPSGRPVLRWTPPENLHLTWKFLGEVKAEETIEHLHEKTATLREEFPQGVALPFHTLETWPPGTSKPNILVLTGLPLPEAAAPFQRQVETVMNTLGFPRETRSFRPHLTVGRFARDTRLSKKYVAELDSPFLLQLSNFHLMRSLIGSAGSQYQIVR